MRSTARTHQQGQKAGLEQRYVVTKNKNGYSIAVVGRDPDTRYQPPTRTFWEKFKARLRIGWLGPDSVYRFGR